MKGPRAVGRSDYTEGGCLSGHLLRWTVTSRKRGRWNLGMSSVLWSCFSPHMSTLILVSLIVMGARNTPESSGSHNPVALTPLVLDPVLPYFCGYANENTNISNKHTLHLSQYPPTILAVSHQHKPAQTAPLWLVKIMMPRALAPRIEYGQPPAFWWNTSTRGAISTGTMRRTRRTSQTPQCRTQEMIFETFLDSQWHSSAPSTSRGPLAACLTMVQRARFVLQRILEVLPVFLYGWMVVSSNPTV